MVEVRFYDTVNDELLKFAVIISQSNGKWVFCKHKERDPFELFHLDMERIGIVPKRAPAKIIDFRAHIENKHTID